MRCWRLRREQIKVKYFDDYDDDFDDDFDDEDADGNGELLEAQDIDDDDKVGDDDDDDNDGRS